MQPYEYKIVKIIPIKRIVPFRTIETDEIEEFMNDLGRLGWELKSTSNVSSSGTTKEIILMFQRKAERLEEMV